MKKLQPVLLYLISAYFAYRFIYHGYLKFDPEGFWSGAFIEKWGYGLYFMFFIGLCEFLGGISLLIPRIARYGAFLLAVIMLGALFTRIIFGTSIDDAVTIAFNMVALLYISIERGIEKDFRKLTSR